MTDSIPLPYSEPVRLNQVPGGLARRLEPDEAARGRIAKALDLASLEAFSADLSFRPIDDVWILKGRIEARAVQTCGLTLEPLPVEIARDFSLRLAEAVDADPEEVDVHLDDDTPDPIEDGRIDLGQYVVEQLALSLDPFPRKPGAEFVPPEPPADISPFAVLKAFKAPDPQDQG